MNNYMDFKMSLILLQNENAVKKPVLIILAQMSKKL